MIAVESPASELVECDLFLVGEVHASVVWTPLLYEKTSLTGDGGHSYTVVRTAVLSCGGGTDGGADCEFEMAAYSEASLLNSPALRTLLGRLRRGPGDAAPPNVEPGRLSPTRLFMRDSISRRLSALPGVGAIN